MSGLLPYVVRFAGENYPREIRIEDSYFVVQIFTCSKTATRLFISNGGIVIFAKFLDLNMDKNRDINLVAIDCINSLLQYKLLLHNDLLSMFVKLGIPEKLAVAVDALVQESEDSTMYKFLQKTLDILATFSAAPQNIQEALCSGDILPLLFDTVKYLDVSCLLKLCGMLHNLANNPPLLNRLENVGIVPLCAMLIKSALEWEGDGVQELMYEVLQLLHLACMLYPSRCEQAALGQVVPLLHKLLFNYTVFHKVLAEIAIRDSKCCL